MSTRFDLIRLSPSGTARLRLPDQGPAEFSDAQRSLLADAGLGDESLYLAWQVAQWATDLDGGERRRLVDLVVGSLLALAQGSTRMPIQASDRQLLLRASQVVGGPGERKPLILDGDHLHHQRVLASETRLAGRLRERLQQKATVGPAGLNSAAESAIDSSRPALTAEQAQAVRTAAEHSMAIITGGPGTGKTTVALAIVRTLIRMGVSPQAVALAAPTGKAANRLEESIKNGLARIEAPDDLDLRLLNDCPRAETLHRLLGYAPSSGSFRHHRNNRLPHKVVLVDEGSMIDLFLMDRLLQAMADEDRKHKHPLPPAR